MAEEHVWITDDGSEKIIMEMYEAGASYDEICERTGLHRKTVACKVRSMARYKMLRLRPEHLPRGPYKNSAKKGKPPVPRFNYDKDGRLWKQLARGLSDPTEEARIARPR